jgi:hypothetical protein
MRAKIFIFQFKKYPSNKRKIIIKINKESRIKFLKMIIKLNFKNAMK